MMKQGSEERPLYSYMRVTQIVVEAFACIALLSHVAKGQTAPTVAVERVTAPIANAQATVRAEHARFTLLTPQLIRMEWDG